MSRLLGTLGVALLVVGAVAGVLRHELLDADRFEQHVDAVRADEHVSRQLGLLLTDRVLAAEPDLTAIRPLIEATAQSTIASPALGPLVRIAVAPTYRALGGDEGSVVLRLADVAALVVATATTLSPEIRATLPAQLDVRLSEFAGQQQTAEGLRQVHLADRLAVLAPLLGLVLLAGAGLPGATSGRFRRAVRYVGRGVVASGVVLAGLLVVTGFLADRADTDTLSGALASAVWDELAGAFWTAAGLLVVAGAAIALTARPGIDLRPRALLRGATSWIVDPEPDPARRLGHAVGLLALGAALVLQPLEVARFVLAVAGACLVVLAVPSLVSSAAELVAARRGRRQASAADACPRRRTVRVVAGLAGGALLVGGYVLAVLPTDDELATAAGAGGAACNGHVELCDRRYDQVAFPATHNAMSAADQPGWFFAEQPDGVIGQLDNGVRVLLIDSWYGQRTDRPGIVVNTDASREKALDEARRTFGAAAVESALRLRQAAQLAPRGPVRLYLCHALCALGSTEWLPLMEQVRAWLVEHPREVVTFFIQDEVSPADTAELVREAGLLPFVHTPAADGSWPTLGSMIESGHRLVLLMENRGGGTDYPWLLDGFTDVQDTPFLFRRPAEFSCARNRGPADAPLFLVNHWITDKKAEVSNAAKVNALDVLLPRLEQCRAERGQIPNYVAVDFYDLGGLMPAVDAINGLD